MTKSEARSRIIAILKEYQPEDMFKQCLIHILNGYDCFVEVFGDENDLIDNPKVFRAKIRYFLIGSGLIEW